MTTATPINTWDEDPDAASILLSLGRLRHDLLVIADPELLAELDAAWGSPASRVRMSYLPGVSAPAAEGEEDQLRSYDRDGIGVLVARGRTRAFEGKPASRVTGLARLVAAAGVRAALIVTRGTALRDLEPGNFVTIQDHLNFSGGPLFPAHDAVQATWDGDLAQRVAQVEGVRGGAIAALVPGPLWPGPAESTMLAIAGAELALMDTVAEGMALASLGVPTCGLVLVDRKAEVVGDGRAAGRRGGRRVKPLGAGTAEGGAAEGAGEAGGSAAGRRSRRVTPADVARAHEPRPDTRTGRRLAERAAERAASGEAAGEFPTPSGGRGAPAAVPGSSGDAAAGAPAAGVAASSGSAAAVSPASLANPADAIAAGIAQHMARGSRRNRPIDPQDPTVPKARRDVDVVRDAVEAVITSLRA